MDDRIPSDRNRNYAEILKDQNFDFGHLNQTRLRWFVAVDIPTAFGRTLCCSEIKQLSEFQMTRDRTERTCLKSELVRISFIRL